MEPAIDGLPAAVIEAQGLLRATPGWTQLAQFYGSAERCLIGHLRASAVKGKVDVAAAHAGILKTLAYRRENELDRPDVKHSVETARCRSFWPFAFADNAPDGSPVEVCRLSRLSMPSILSTFPEDEVVHFFGLWCELNLRLYGQSVAAGAATKGSLHVYDCRGVSWSTLLSDARRHWAAVTRVFCTGQDHWPDLSARYFIIHAPFAVHYAWKLIAPLASEGTRAKVSFCKGVPPELVSALGGEDAVERTLTCSPHVLPGAPPPAAPPPPVST